MSLDLKYCHWTSDHREFTYEFRRAQLWLYSCAKSARGSAEQETLTKQAGSESNMRTK